MRAFIVVEVEMPGGGSMRELNKIFDAVQELPYKVNSHLVSQDYAMDYIRPILPAAISGVTNTRRKKR